MSRFALILFFCLGFSALTEASHSLRSPVRNCLFTIRKALSRQDPSLMALGVHRVGHLKASKEVMRFRSSSTSRDGSQEAEEHFLQLKYDLRLYLGESFPDDPTQASFIYFFVEVQNQTKDRFALGVYEIRRDSVGKLSPDWNYHRNSPLIDELHQAGILTYTYWEESVMLLVRLERLGLQKLQSKRPELFRGLSERAILDRLPGIH